MSKFARGKFTMKHPEKYIGNKIPIYRSSWEWHFMNVCDSNDSIQKWASEAVQIPYRDPLTGRQTVYVPDFFIQYIDKNNRVLTELIEIKPASQQLLEKVGKSRYNQEQYVKNMAKWDAANKWCRNNGIKFRIINENDIFHNTGKRR